MTRTAKITLTLIVLGLCAVTSRREHSSRVHMDSLQAERRVITYFGPIPVWKSERPPTDRFPGVYASITGHPPDPERWQQMPVDYVRSPLRSSYFCYGLDFHDRQRRQMLEALFIQFRDEPDKHRAADLLRRIDLALPAPFPKGQHLPAPEVLDALRKDLGLEAYFSSEVSE